jgi:hypothetical protein
MAGRLNLVSAPAAAVSARQAGLTKGKTGSRVARKHAPVKNVDQEAVQQPEPQVRRTAWSFDHDAAEALYAHAQDTAVQFAKLEHNLPLAMRAFGKAIRAFVVTLMPDREIDTLRRRLTGQGVLHGNDVLPDDVVEFLLAKNLPLPHFNSLNPLQGIVAHFYQCARLSQQYTQPLEAQHEINVASRPLTADDLVGDEAKRLTAAQQTQQSKLARWVLAAVEMPEDLKAKTGGERLFDKGFPAAIEEWTEWREKNPYMVISTTKPKMVRKTKAEKEAEGRRREEQDEARRMQRRWQHPAVYQRLRQMRCWAVT